MNPPRSRRSTLHDFRVGELVALEQPVAPFGTRVVLQVLGFRGDTHLRVLPVGGIPMLCPYQAVARTGVAGSARPPQRRRPRPRTKPVTRQSATA